jgi:hypothetical protein
MRSNTARPSAATEDQVLIADWRLTIEKVVWQLLPMSISPPGRENQQSTIGNFT